MICVAQDQLFSPMFEPDIIDFSPTNNIVRTDNFQIDLSSINPFDSPSAVDMKWKQIFGPIEDNPFYIYPRDQFVARWTPINLEYPPFRVPEIVLDDPQMQRIQRFRSNVGTAVFTQLVRSSSRTQLKLGKLAAGTCC